MLTEYKEQLRDRGEVYLRVKALPGSAYNKILNIMDDETIKIAIKKVAEKSKANKELVSFLSKEFQVNKQNVNIISGGTARLKLIKIII